MALRHRDVGHPERASQAEALPPARDGPGRGGRAGESKAGGGARSQGAAGSGDRRLAGGISHRVLDARRRGVHTRGDRSSAGRRDRNLEGAAVAGARQAAECARGFRRGVGAMTDDRFDWVLREAAQDYHRPPDTPREEMWQRIEAARRARRARVLALRPWLRWGLAAAAVLAIGVGLGRVSMRHQQTIVVAPGDLAYRVAAAPYLSRTEALLTGFRSEARSGRLDVQFAGQARDLRRTTRLMLDSPAAEDPRLRNLLEDLELVLAQIAQVPRGSDREDLQLINQGLEQRSVLLRLRTANPAGPGPVRAQGAL